MFLSAGWVPQPHAAPGQAGKICQKYQGAETPARPELPLFPPVTHCLPSPVTLAVPACFPPASVPVFLPASLPGFLSLLCCSRQGTAALALELPASLSLRRIQGPLGRGKQYQVLDPSLSNIWEENRAQQSVFFLVPDAVMGMLTVPILP